MGAWLRRVICAIAGHRYELVAVDHDMDEYPFWSETYKCDRCGRCHEVL